MPFFEDALKSLTFSKTNKVNGGNEEQQQGVVSDLLPELTLETDDTVLLKLDKQWTAEWDKFKEKEDITRRQEKGEKYWLGKQMEKKRYANEDNSVDNLVFEALETFLPIATRQNPEPVIESPINTVESMEFNNLIKEQLVWIADDVRLRLKIKRAARHWALSLVGVIKMAWDLEKKIPVPYVVRPQKMILDPNSTIEEGHYTGAFAGELKEEAADGLVIRFPEAKEFVTKMVNGEMGTKIRYVEWWTNEMVFWVLDKHVLGKMRNPHWDYGEDTEQTMDDFGEQVQNQLPAINHFSAPKMPYCFLSVFNLGKYPVDDTALIEQVIPMQNEVNRLNRQIARNVAQMNGTVVVSSDVFNKDQSKSIADAVRDGRPVMVPGSVNEAYKRDSAPNIPGDVFNHRNDMRNELRGVFGVTGATAQGIANEDTVRGKIMVREQDSSRIGGGISVYIEQLADDIFNWLVQMIYVYFDEADVAMLLGDEKAIRFMALKAVYGQKRLRVSIKEGSLIPKDSLTQRNEAIELFTAGALDPIELFKKLDYPDPEESARKLVKWKQNMLFPDLNPQAPPTAVPGAPPIEEAPVDQSNPLSAVPI